MHISNKTMASYFLQVLLLKIFYEKDRLRSLTLVLSWHGASRTIWDCCWLWGML